MNTKALALAATITAGCSMSGTSERSTDTDTYINYADKIDFTPHIPRATDAEIAQLPPIDPKIEDIIKSVARCKQIVAEGNKRLPSFYWTRNWPATKAITMFDAKDSDTTCSCTIIAHPYIRPFSSTEAVWEESDCFIHYSKNGKKYSDSITINRFQSYIDRWDNTSQDFDMRYQTDFPVADKYHGTSVEKERDDLHKKATEVRKAIIDEMKIRGGFNIHKGTRSPVIRTTYYGENDNVIMPHNPVCLK